MRLRPMWSLLASDNAPETIGYLQLLLYDQNQSLTVSVFVERLKLLLNDMSEETINDAQAQTRMNSWRNAGYIAIRYTEEQQEPVVELTAAAHEAIRFIAGQRVNRISPTESRLELVIHAVRKLVMDTDLNEADRIARLEEDKRRIDEQIKAVKAGRMDTITEVEIKAQIYDLLQMLENLNGDFYRVRDRFRDLSEELHEDILRNDGTASSILSDFFAGYDRIGDSEEGKTFKAFYAFLNNPEAIAQIDDALEALQTRDFWQGQISDTDKRDILYMRRRLNERARETQGIMRLLASSLKHLVQSREYLQNRRLMQLIGETKREALSARDHLSPLTRIMAVSQSSAEVSSSSAMSLHDPQTDATIVPMVSSQSPDVNFEALSARVQAAEINYPWLKNCVKEVLEHKEVATIADVLDAHPATQGLASVVGLISLAVRFGEMNASLEEKISWKNRLGQSISATIPMLIFSKQSLTKFEANSP